VTITIIYIDCHSYLQSTSSPTKTVRLQQQSSLTKTVRLQQQSIQFCS